MSEQDETSAWPEEWMQNPLPLRFCTSGYGGCYTQSDSEHWHRHISAFLRQQETHQQLTEQLRQMEYHIQLHEMELDAHEVLRHEDMDKQMRQFSSMQKHLERLMDPDGGRAAAASGQFTPNPNTQPSVQSRPSASASNGSGPSSLHPALRSMLQQPNMALTAQESGKRSGRSKGYVNIKPELQQYDMDTQQKNFILAQHTAQSLHFCTCSCFLVCLRLCFPSRLHIVFL
jgi:hypothetical protein